MKCRYLIVFTFALLLPAYVFSQCDPAAAWNPSPSVQSGVSSWFDAQAQGGSSQYTGACSWPKSLTDVNVAAYTASTNTAECTLCGDCYNVTGPVGSVVVRVIDYCNTNPGPCGLSVTPQWTLNKDPFITIAGSTSYGSVPVTWYGPVPCYSLTGDLVYTGLSGSNVWYVNVRVSYHRYPLKSVEFSNPNVNGNPYTLINRYPGNQWYYNPSAQQGWPFNIRVTDVRGAVVYDTIDLATMSANKTGTGGNFPDVLSTSPTVSPSPSLSPTKSISLTSSKSVSPSKSLSSSTSRSATRSLTASKSATPTRSH